MPETGIKILGGVLAGGQSTRMGGREKSLLVAGGKPLIERVIQRLAPQLCDIVINANGQHSRFSSLSAPVVGDVFEDYAGPLAGIHALMDYAIKAPADFTHIASVAADTPFFPLNFVEKCGYELSSPDFNEIVIAKSGGFHHPVFGLWPVALFPSLDKFLQSGKTRKVMAFVKQHPHCFAEFSFTRSEELEIDPFFNINTPLDMEKACAIISAMELNNEDD